MDALDTLYIMGLHEEFKDGQEWIEQNLDFGVVRLKRRLIPSVQASNPSFSSIIRPLIFSVGTAGSVHLSLAAFSPSHQPPLLIRCWLCSALCYPFKPLEYI